MLCSQQAGEFVFFMKRFFFVTVCLWIGPLVLLGNIATWPQYNENPFSFSISRVDDSTGIRPGGRGGLLVYDVTGDGLLDYLVSRPGKLLVYDRNGNALWDRSVDIRLTAKSETEGLPGLHAPGFQVGDPNKDGVTDLLFFSLNGDLHWLNAQTGETQTVQRLKAASGRYHWEHLVISNLRGTGDADLVVQSTNTDNYRMGKYIAAFAINDIEKIQFLWESDKYVGCAHNGLRVADLNGDGRDEILGATFFHPNGKSFSWCKNEKTFRQRFISLIAKSRILKKVFCNRYVLLCNTIPYHFGHIDSIFVDDVLLDNEGLEVVMLQEGGPQEVFVAGSDGLLWQKHYLYQESQNAAIGDFDLSSEGLEIWCRSRYDKDQRPFVFSAKGELIASWRMNDMKPHDWSKKGVEVISTIRWNESGPDWLAAKERHTSGNVALFDAISGKFYKVFEQEAERIFVADVSGDPREELIVMTKDEIFVYWNDKPLKKKQQSRLWDKQHYRRSKTNHNYYSP